MKRRRQLIKTLRELLAGTPEPTNAASARHETHEFDVRQLAKYAGTGHVLIVGRGLIKAIVEELENREP